MVFDERRSKWVSNNTSNNIFPTFGCWLSGFQPQEPLSRFNKVNCYYHRRRSWTSCRPCLRISIPIGITLVVLLLVAMPLPNWSWYGGRTSSERLERGGAGAIRKKKKPHQSPSMTFSRTASFTLSWKFYRQLGSKPPVAQDRVICSFWLVKSRNLSPTPIKIFKWNFRSYLMIWQTINLGHPHTEVPVLLALVITSPALPHAVDRGPQRRQVSHGKVTPQVLQQLDEREVNWLLPWGCDLEDGW